MARDQVSRGNAAQFWVSSVVCQDCAECAISDGHMKPQDFEWWTPMRRPREPRCE